MTAKQKEKATKRRDTFRKLARIIGAMSENKRAQLAAQAGITNCEGHPLSVHNCCLAWTQNNLATMVGGYRQWLKLGRQVRRGEHGIMIWIPCKPKKDSENKKTFFISGTVFDVSQTEGGEV